MHKKIAEILDDIYPILQNFHNQLSNIIYENQEGQVEHFDKLPKSEQLAIYSVFVTIKTVLNAIYSYKTWFS